MEKLRSINPNDENQQETAKELAASLHPMMLLNDYEKDFESDVNLALNSKNVKKHGLSKD